MRFKVERLRRKAKGLHDLNLSHLGLKEFEAIIRAIVNHFHSTAMLA